MGCGDCPNHRHHYLKRVSDATTLDNTMRHIYTHIYIYMYINYILRHYHILKEHYNI